MGNEADASGSTVGRAPDVVVRRTRTMNRRTALLAVIGLVTAATGCAAEPKSPAAPPRVAFLSGDKTCATNEGLLALRDGLQALGYREAESLTIECRTAEGRYERLDALAQELAGLKPNVLVAAATPASLAAKRATGTIPIVSVYTASPVELGLVMSLARPGTNVTGISALASDYAAKSLQLLKEAAPRTARVAVLGHAGNPTFAIYRRQLEPAARAIGLTLDFVAVQALGDIEAALLLAKRRGADAVFVMHQPFTFAHRERVVEAVARLRLPGMYGSREAVEQGGLISYAASVDDTFRRAAYFVDRVLHGSQPGDLPMEQPTKFELFVNARTARALELPIPKAILLRADRVIE